MFDLINGAVGRVLHTTRLHGISIRKEFSRLWALNHFNFIINPDHIGVISPNPYSPEGRFGLSLGEAFLFLELTGVILGAVASTIGHYPNKFEIGIMYDHMKEEFEQEIEEILTLRKKANKAGEN